MGIYITDIALCTLGFPDEEIENFVRTELPKVTFKKLYHMLVIYLPIEEETIICHDDSDLKELVKGPKYCKYLIIKNEDYYCNKADLQKDTSDGLTTFEICQKCPVLDSRVLCSHVTGLRTVAHATFGKPIGDRLVSKAGCHLGKNVNNTENCFPSGCNQLTYVIETEEEKRVGFLR